MIPESRGQRTLISLLRRTAQLMVADVVERLGAAGYPDLPVAAHPVFETLDPGGTRLTELAARTDMTHQAMGELIDTLEHRGYVVRRPDPADGRARLVYLTDKGRQMTRVALREIAAIEAEWSRSWNGASLRSDLMALEHYLRQSDSLRPRTRSRRPTAKIAP